jgi:hypothetical protein
MAVITNIVHNTAHTLQVQYLSLVKHTLQVLAARVWLPLPEPCLKLSQEMCPIARPMPAAAGWLCCRKKRAVVPFLMLQGHEVCREFRSQRQLRGRQGAHRALMAEMPVRPRPATSALMS